MRCVLFACVLVRLRFIFSIFVVFILSLLLSLYFLLSSFYYIMMNKDVYIKILKINAYTLFRLGDCIKKFHNEHGRTQCSDYVTDGGMRIRFVLDTIYGDSLALISWRQYRLSRFCLQLQHGTGVHQQQHQSFHLRCQVPRVPARRQASDIETETESMQ